MNNPEVEVHVTSERKLSTSEPNSIIAIVDTISEKIFLNQTTGNETHRFTPVPPLFRININPRSASPDDIRPLLHNTFLSYVPLVLRVQFISPKDLKGCNRLRCRQQRIYLDHGRYSYLQERHGYLKRLNMNVIIQGRMKAEELKSLNMETELCSICLDNLIGPKASGLTRMPCSHVFHDDRVFEWLKRKNTCPLCRTVLYD